MPKAYSQDLRDRVIDAVERGGLSRRAAARRYEISESVAVKWLERVEREGSREPVGHSGHRPAKLMPHRDFLETARREKPDITLQALCDHLLSERGIKADTSMMSRFFRRIGVTFKKRPSSREQDRPDISRHRKRWRAYQGLIDPKRLVFIDETWTKTNMTRLHGWAPKGQRLVDKVPHGHWETATFLAALRNDRIEAPCLIDGPKSRML
ncbi:MAG: IS630 family transposase [Methylocella sp.]